MMPSERKARLDLERATGTTKGRLTAAERWGDPLSLVLHDHFPGDAQPLPPWKTILGTGSASVGCMSGITGVSVNSGTTSGQSAQLSWAGSVFIGGSGLMRGFTADAAFRAVARFDYDAASPTDENTVSLCGFATATGFSADGAYIGFDGLLTTSYMVAVTRKNGIAQVTPLNGSGGTMIWQPTGLETQTWRLIEIVCDQENAAIRFYVDGFEAAVHSQDIPSAATDYVMPWFGAMNRGASGVNRKIEVDVVMAREGWAA